MNLNQRRKSTLGRRNRNGEKPEKFSFGPLTLPVVAPKSGTRLGRQRGGTKLKASSEFTTSRQLFSLSSAKKSQFGSSSSRRIYTSPNDSQGSYQSSNNSLNLTGIQSMQIQSPNYYSAPTVQKSYQDCKKLVPSTYLENSSSIKKATKWNAMSLKPPPSPPPSQYERLIRLEMACIKPPVDPDDLKNDLENLTLNENFFPGGRCFKPITSTATKEVDVSKFSPHLSSTSVNTTFMLSSEKGVNPAANDLSNVQTLETVDLNSDLYNNDNKHSLNNTNKLFNIQEENSLSVQSKVNNNQINGSPNHMSKNLDTINLNDQQHLFKNPVVKPLNSEKYFVCNADPKQDFNTDRKDDSSKNKISNPVNKPVIRSLHFDEFELSKNQSSSSAKTYVEKSKETRLFKKPLDSTLSCERNHSANISIGSPLPIIKHSSTLDTDVPKAALTSEEESNILLSANKHCVMDRRLSNINEIIENNFPGEDLNSTDSFLMAEQTIIDQDQYNPKTTSLIKASKTVVNDKLSKPEVDETSGSDDEIDRTMVKFDTILNKMACLRSEMNDCESEMKSVKASLQKLISKRSKTKEKNTQNKENVPTFKTPTTKPKQFKSKWFNEMKLENPNLLKTPNPARQSVSRMSLANQSIMTPHSLSIVITEQIDDLFN